MSLRMVWRLASKCWGLDGAKFWEQSLWSQDYHKLSICWTKYPAWLVFFVTENGAWSKAKRRASVGNERGRGSRSAEDRGRGSRTAEGRGRGTRSAEDRGRWSRSAEGMGRGSRSAEGRGRGSRSAEGRGRGTRSAEDRAEDPGQLRTGAEEPGQLRTEAEGPGQLRTETDDPGQLRLWADDPDQLRTEAEEPGQGHRHGIKVILGHGQRVIVVCGHGERGCRAFISGDLLRCSLTPAFAWWYSLIPGVDRPCVVPESTRHKCETPGSRGHIHDRHCVSMFQTDMLNRASGVRFGPVRGLQYEQGRAVGHIEGTAPESGDSRPMSAHSAPSCLVRCHGNCALPPRDMQSHLAWAHGGGTALRPGSPRASWVLLHAPDSRKQIPEWSGCQTWRACAPGLCIRHDGARALAVPQSHRWSCCAQTYTYGTYFMF